MIKEMIEIEKFQKTGILPIEGSLLGIPEDLRVACDADPQKLAEKSFIHEHALDKQRQEEIEGQILKY